MNPLPRLTLNNVLYLSQSGSRIVCIDNYTTVCDNMYSVTNIGTLCMPELRVRDVESWIVDSIKANARKHGRSMEGEIKELLRTEAMRSKEKLRAELMAMYEDGKAKYGVLSDSTLLIREDRDSRG